MGKPITIVNKMAESVLTQEPQNASSLTQAPYRSLLQDKFAASCKAKSGLGSAKHLDSCRAGQKLLRSPNRT